MSISEICIKRPVFATVLSLMIVSIGMVFLNKLQIMETPNIDQPVISIQASYSGADAKFMEQVVTIPIENAVKNIQNLSYVTSSSSQGSSNITLIFELGTDIDSALSDVRSNISEVSHQFPEDMSIPAASKYDPEANPSLWIAISTDKYTELELTTLVDKYVKTPLNQLSTVGNIFFGGARYYSIYIEPDPYKMYSNNVTANDIDNAVASASRDYPAGILKTLSRDYYITLKGTLEDTEGYKQIVLKNIENGFVRVEDVADVSYKPQDTSILVRYNGNKAVALGIVKQAGANLLKMATEVKKELEEIKKDLPLGIDVRIAYDTTKAVNASINEVIKTILEAILLVIIVIYLFLGSVKATIIPALAIPISLIGNFSLMYAFGFSINIFTLLAMILAIGIVVDDAIVMLENIYKKVEKGLKPIEASIVGAKEIQFAVIAMTFTLAAVFLPIGFIEGFIGQLFIQFAWTLAFTVLFSGFVALTITPMLCSKIIAANNAHTSLTRFQSFIEFITLKYLKMLKWVLNNSKKFTLLCLVTLITLVFFFKFTLKEFVPAEDEGILNAVIKGPEGSTLKHTETYLLEAENIMKATRGVDSFFSIVGWGGANKGYAFIPLTDYDKRSESYKEIRDKLNVAFQNITGVSAFAFSPPSSVSGRAGHAVTFHVTSSDDFDELNQKTLKMIEKMKNSKVFVNVDRDAMNIPMVKLEVMRDKAAMLGVSVKDIGNTIQYLMAGKRVGQYVYDNQVYPVRIWFNEENRNSLNDLNKIFIKNSDDKMLSLQNVISMKEELSLASYTHYNTLNSITITSDLQLGFTAEDAFNEIEKFAGEIIRSSKDKIIYEGDIQSMKESSSQILYKCFFYKRSIWFIKPYN